VPTEPSYYVTSLVVNRNNLDRGGIAQRHGGLRNTLRATIGGPVSLYYECYLDNKTISVDFEISLIFSLHLRSFKPNRVRSCSDFVTGIRLDLASVLVHTRPIAESVADVD
jgi:hypothetical protein